MSTSVNIFGQRLPGWVTYMVIFTIIYTFWSNIILLTAPFCYYWIITLCLWDAGFLKFIFKHIRNEINIRRFRNARPGQIYYLYSDYWDGRVKSTDSIEESDADKIIVKKCEDCVIVKTDELDTWFVNRVLGKAKKRWPDHDILDYKEDVFKRLIEKHVKNKKDIFLVLI